MLLEGAIAGLGRQSPRSPRRCPGGRIGAAGNRVKDRALYSALRSVGFEPKGRVTIEYLRSEADL
jgi:hypothetical protein